MVSMDSRTELERIGDALYEIVERLDEIIKILKRKNEKIRTNTKTN